MKKEAFISTLKKYLSVLEEKEIQDIIEEYEQHIDMKMQKGLSEEDAIADFGDLKELCAGILEAYHVKADYKEKKNLDFTKVKEESKKATGKATNVLEKAVQGFGNAVKKIVYMIGKVLCAVGTGIRFLFSSIIRFITAPFDKIRNRTTNKKSPHLQDENKENMILSGLGTAFLKVAGGIGRFFGFCKKTLWNFLWIIIGTVATVGTLCIIFMFGLATVLLFMGYPMIGIEIVIIGLGLIGSTVMIFSFSMIRKRKKKEEKTDALLEFGMMEVMERI